MWKPSKITLLLFMILMAILGGVTFSYIDWEHFNNLKEIQLPLIFLVLSIYFMVLYVKKLKEEG